MRGLNVCLASARSCVFQSLIVSLRPVTRPAAHALKPASLRPVGASALTSMYA